MNSPRIPPIDPPITAIIPNPVHSARIIAIKGVALERFFRHSLSGHIDPIMYPNVASTRSRIKNPLSPVNTPQTNRIHTNDNNPFIVDLLTYACLNEYLL